MMKELDKPIYQFIPYWNIEEKNAVLDVLNGDYLLEHKKTREFEAEFAKFVGAKYCITCTSGTIALYLAIKALRKHFGMTDHVNIPDSVGHFVANALIQSGKEPILTDVSPNGSMSIFDTDSIVVHANGRLGAVTGMIEDCCQAINYHTNKRVSCYSFASTKHLTTGGQGGAVCCDDKDIFDELSRLKDHGRTDRQNLKPASDEYDHWGTNFKFTEIQASFGLIQLKKLPDKLERLREMYNLYRNLLDDDVNCKFFGDLPSWYIDMKVIDPDGLVAHLKNNKIFSRRFFKPLHMHSLYKPFAVIDTEYAMSNALYECGVFLPSTTNITDEEIQFIAKKIKEFYH